jgi:hypothetical protein
MALAHMANNENKLLTAFQFRELVQIIAIKGWGNFIIWYIVIGILFFILAFIIGAPIIIFTIIIHTFIRTIPLHLLQDELLSLLLFPYLYMYFGRSIALFYKSDKIHSLLNDRYEEFA